MSDRRCEECKTKLQATEEAPRCAKCAGTTPEQPKRQVGLYVDPELALDHRVSRLEELELLRLALHQAHEEHSRCVESQRAAEAQHWAEQMNEAQKKIAAIVQAINRTVRSRLDERDRRKEKSS